MEKHKKNLIEKAKERFGITDNCQHGGYILPNGEMLNFKRKSDFIQHQRIEVIYYKLGLKNEAIKIKEKNPECDIFNSAENFYIDTGAIRMNLIIDELNLEIYDENEITKKQWETIEYCAYTPKVETINIDIVKCKESGIEYDNISEYNDDARELIKEVKREYNKIL